MSNTNYGSNYNEIFEDSSPELDGQTLAINELDIYLSNELSSETDYKDGNDEVFQEDSPVNSISRHNQGNRNFLIY